MKKVIDTLGAIAAFVAVLGLLSSIARGAEPPRFTVENKCAPAFTVVNKTAPRDTFRASDGILYERHSDGVYRAVPGQAAPAVAAPTFRSGGYSPSHRCPSCGYQSPAGQGTWIVRGHNADGTHSHQCPSCGTLWRH